jgi:hypothetical protein
VCVCIVGTAAPMEALLLLSCSVVPRPSFLASVFCADFRPSDLHVRLTVVRSTGSSQDD